MSCRECVNMCLSVCVCKAGSWRTVWWVLWDYGMPGKGFTSLKTQNILIQVWWLRAHTHKHTLFFSHTHLIGYSIKIRPKLDQQGPPSWLSCLPNTLTRKEQNWQFDNWMTNVRETVWTMITFIILPGLSDRVEKNREDEDAAQQTSIRKAFKRNSSW